jgi:hypothetical protein
VSYNESSGQSPLNEFPFITFVGQRPTCAKQIIQATFQGTELPLSAKVIAALSDMICEGKCIRLHAKNADDLRRCSMAIAFAVGLLPMPTGERVQ